MEQLLRYINDIYPLPSEKLQKLLNISQLVSYKSGEHLTELGTVNHKVFFIVNGVTRTYMKETPQSQEINKSLAGAGSMASSIKSSMNKTPAKIACQCLTDCIILEIEERELIELRSQCIDFSEFMYKALQFEYTKIEEALLDLLSKDATQRYLILRTKIKDIDQLIPQYHIASHLGITPIQLSRIRKKLLSK